MDGEKPFFVNLGLGNLQTLFALPVRIAGGLKEKKSSTHPQPSCGFPKPSFNLAATSNP
jgi:hypothetical protein